jgi:hypothetical protein
MRKTRSDADATAWKFARRFQEFMDKQEAEGVSHSASIVVTMLSNGNEYVVSTYGIMTTMEDEGDGVELHVNVQRAPPIPEDVPGECPMLGPKPVNRGA